MIVYAAVFSMVLFIGMLACMELGYQIGRRRREGDLKGGDGGTGIVDAAIFGLLGLILAFSFSGAASRFDDRRRLITEEANAIGTAYLRLDLLPAEAQPALRESFRQYLDARLEAYRRIPDVSAAMAKLAESTRHQKEIWSKAQAAARAGNWPPAAMLLLPAINEMIDITTTQFMATKIHPPMVIFGLMFALAILCSLLAGYNASVAPNRRWLHQLLFAAAIAIAVYVIIDLEYPRLGLIRVDAADQVLVDLRNSMK